jgi:small subunit ribosomal protein S12
MTYNQNIRIKTKRVIRFRRTRALDLYGCPQKKAYCFKFAIKTPKKPHSARRKTVRVLVLSTKEHIYSYIPGIGYTLQKYSNLLIRGGRRRDIPGMKYTAIRGTYDFRSPLGRRTSRSKYGLKRFD